MLSMIFLLPSSFHTMSVGEKTVYVEVARTESERARGLMGRTELETDHGMLFVFEEPAILSFWMKNTLIPLSIAFCDQEKNIIEIFDMPVISSQETKIPVFYSSRAAQYALEMPVHWFRDNNVHSGMKISFHDR